ncbi:MAG: PAS domain S-box protein [Thermodesulfobacteriota bacterium]
MDDGNKTKKELLLEIKDLRRQLAEARFIHEVGGEIHQDECLGVESERQQLLKNLEQERARLKAIFESAPEGIVVADAQGRIAMANRVADALCGQPIPRGEFAALAYLRPCHPDGTPYEPRQLPLIRAALDGETFRNVEMGIRYPDGTWRDLLINASPIKDFWGEITGAVAVFQDTTDLQKPVKEQKRLLAELLNYSEELKISNENLKIFSEELQVQNETLAVQAEELENLANELEAGRNFLQAVLEQMPAGVIIAEPSGRITLSNRRAEAIWQQSPGSLTDLEKFQQIPRFYPDGRPYPAEDIPLSRALILGKTVADDEELLERQDDGGVRRIHLKVNARPVRDQQGAIIAAVATYEDTTARKQAQAELRQSEERYRSLVELSPDAIVVHARGKIVFVNHAAVKLFGAARRKDLLGQPLMDRIHPDYHDHSRECVRKIRSGEKIKPQEEKVLRLDGEVVEVEVTGGAIIYQGQPAMQVVLRDITERKRAREALRAANEKLRTMIEASPLAIVHLNRNGTILSCNPATERIFGWRAEELVGRYLPLVSRNKWKEARDVVQRVFQGELITGLEVRGRRKDGDWIDIGLSAAPMYDGNGGVTGIVGLAEDITPRKQAEAALAKSRAEFEAIFNSIADAIIFADPERRIVLVNPAVKTLFGYEPWELIGKSTEMLYAGRADFDRTREKYFFSGDRMEPTLFEITYRRKDGTLFSAESLASRVKDAGGNILGAVGIHRDITERKMAEAALKESQRQAEMLAELLENSSQPFAVGLLDGRIGMFNTAYQQLLGYSQRELSRLSWDKDLTPPEWREYSMAQLEELRRTGKPVRYEKEYLRKDGTRVPVELFVHLRQDEHGKPLHYYGFITDITGRKQAEEALRKGEEEIKSIFRAAPIGIGVVANRIIKAANDRLCEMTGYRLEELIGQSSRMLYPSDEEYERVGVEKYRQIAEHGAGTVETLFRRKDGTLINVLLSSTPIDLQDLEKGVTFTALDITERKQVETALQRAKQEWERTFDTVPDLIFILDNEHRIIRVNRATAELLGTTPKDLVGRTCYEAMHNTSEPPFFCPHSRMMTEGREQAIEVHEFGQDFLMTVTPLVGDLGNIIGSVHVARDITGRKQAEEALGESEARFRQLAENLDDAILLASGDWRRVHYISPAYERLWGRSCESLYQEPLSWLESVEPEDLEEVESGLKKRMTGDYSEKEFPHFRIRRPDGAVRWIAARFLPIRNEAGDIYRIAGIATDITVRKEMEAVLQWRQEHLRQTAKMEAVGRLAGGVAHDFNNLLTVINGYGELLLADLKETDSGRQQVQAILKAADQATAVTRQLLAFSRRQVLQPQILDLNELITGLVEMFSRLVDENIDITMHLEPELGAVKADPSHMEQVIMNLVINALDAMPQGGSLILETANVQVTPRDVRRHPDIAPGAFVVATVRDTGIGMTREILSRIFEPFFTTKEREKGTGLGLSVAYGIVNQSGGYILVESKPGKGSSFRIYLPREEQAEKPAVAAAPRFESTQGTDTILLVEDEEGVRYVVQRMLALKGYSVLAAHDGQEALKIGQSHPGPIHLLLTDVAMPGIGGLELAKNLTSSHPGMKVLFMSGHTEDGMVQRGVRESVINFIQKPFRTDQLLRKIKELLEEPKT